MRDLLQGNVMTTKPAATIRIASDCHNRALLLFQIAQECPQLKEQATYLALRWLGVATIADFFRPDLQAEKGGPRQLEDE
jgi:hypothetical protein